MVLVCPNCDSLFEALCDCGYSEERVDGVMVGREPPGRVAVVEAGSTRITKSLLSRVALSALRAGLTVVPNAYMDKAAEPFQVFEEDETYIYVPRCYPARFPGAGAVKSRFVFGDGLVHEGRALSYQAALLEERDQPNAFSAMTQCLESSGVGTLQAFTDFGKTYVSLAIGAHFGRRIAVVTHIEHMLKNWVSVAAQVLGIPEDAVGVIGGGVEKVGPVTVMLAQSLTRKVRGPDLFDKFGFVVFDEVHHYGCREWQRIPGMFDARYRLGVSATPSRKDGLTDVVRWHFGDVAYKARNRKDEGSEKTVVQISYDKSYPYRSYANMGGGVGVNPQRYQKKQAKDDGRNRMLVGEMVAALRKGRRGLVQSHFRDHAEVLHDMFVEAVRKAGLDLPVTMTLFGGARNKAERQKLDDAHDADWIFATYGFTREAISLRQIDTLVFGTSPGDPVQAVGRLRVGPDKRPLLCLDTFENTEYSRSKAARRRECYLDNKVKVLRVKRAEIPTKKKRKSASTAKKRGIKGGKKRGKDAG